MRSVYRLFFAFSLATSLSSHAASIDDENVLVSSSSEQTQQDSSTSVSAISSSGTKDVISNTSALEVLSPTVPPIIQSAPIPAPDPKHPESPIGLFETKAPKEVENHASKNISHASDSYVAQKNDAEKIEKPYESSPALENKAEKPLITHIAVPSTSNAVTPRQDDVITPQEEHPQEDDLSETFPVIDTETSAEISPEEILKPIDDAFEVEQLQEAQAAKDAQLDKTAQAAEQATKELLSEQHKDPLDIALLMPQAEPLDSVFLDAEKAFRTEDLTKLEETKVVLSQHPLFGYIELWTLLLKIKTTPDSTEIQEQIAAFIDAHKGEYLSERARVDYLRVIAPSMNESLFHSLYDALRWNKNEPDIKCWQMLYQLQDISTQSDSLLSSAKKLYRDTRPLNEATKALGDKIMTLDPAWAWSRIIIDLQKNRLTEIKRILTLTSVESLPASIEVLGEIIDTPQQWFNRNREKIQDFPARLSVFATLRLAPVLPVQAAEIASIIQNKLSASWKALIWNRIGYVASTNLMPEAVEWYNRAGPSLSDSLIVVNRHELLAWHARASLRARDWTSLNRIIQSMPLSMQKEENWTYWHARSLNALGDTAKAKSLFEQVSSNVSFYGKLACDNLNRPYTFQKPLSEAIQPNEISRWEDNASLIRAREFYRMGLYSLGHREWNWALQGLKDREYVALAEFAKEKLLIHRMINTSVRSGSSVIDIEQRFPMPHRSAVTKVALAQHIEPAWVYGLIRQESRFITRVSSSVGARGLMQIMPATAQWVAQKIGITTYDQAQLTDFEMNLILGTAYLRMLYDDLDNNYILATAAYNAGPNRARMWRATLTEPLEAAIFIETIPFHETRDYVKKVMSNMQTYSMQTDHPIEQFTQFLSNINPGSASRTELP